VGSADHNQALSERRAEAVRQALLTRGVDSARVSVRGYGEDHAVADNDSSGGRQLNRRVEIVLSDDGGVIMPR
ncbi:MAG TPA: OmpA family protein, partial [Aquabacterium sp.]|nr:OmpA family protein [Aquabacterium sp.]